MRTNMLPCIHSHMARQAFTTANGGMPPMGAASERGRRHGCMASALAKQCIVARIRTSRSDGELHKML